MGCIKTSTSGTVQDLLFMEDNKGYNEAELIELKSKITTSIAWLNGNIGDISNDIIILRVGVPALTSNGVSDATTTYTNTFSSDNYLMTSFLSVDYIKISSKTSRGAKTYHYSSDYRHRLYGNYFKDDVYWVHQLVEGTFKVPQYLSNSDLTNIKSRIANVPVKYNGVSAGLDGIGDVPQVLVDTVTMLAQNSNLFKKIVNVEGDTSVVVGDKLAMNIYSFIEALDNAVLEIDRKINRIAPENYEDIRYAMDFMGFEQAFEDIRYGGTIDDARALIRIPASYDHENVLKNIIEIAEVAEYHGKAITDVTPADEQSFFESIFPSEMITEEAFSEKNIEDGDHKAAKYLALRDTDIVINVIAKGPWSASNTISGEELFALNSWYDTNYSLTSYTELNALIAPTYSQTKGCRYKYTTEVDDGNGGTTTTVTHDEHRHFRVAYQWFKDLPIEKKMVLFYLGMDLKITNSSACPLDQIIMVVVIIVISYYSFGALAGTASGTGVAGSGMTLAQIGVVTSAVISVGLTLGVWKGKDARNLAIAAAVISIYSGYQAAVSATSTTGIMNAIFSMISAATNAVSTYENYEFQKDLERKQKELDEAEKAAEMYESNLRFMYGEGFGAHVRNSCEADPYKYIKDTYESYSTYQSSGFKG